MRIGIGGLHHETNSFSNIPITRELLDSRSYAGQKLIDDYTGVRNYIGGFISKAQQLGIELAPAVMSYCTPSGHITQDTLEYHRERLVEMLWQAHQEKPLDAVALNLHGAGVADGYPDADGALLRAVRERFGPELPVGVVMDLHANVADHMLELADIVIGVKCYPHVDEYEAGQIMFEQLVDITKNGYRPAMRLVRLPWLIAPAEGVTTSGPAHDVQQLCYQLEAEERGLMQASFFQGFPYADVEECAVTVVTVAKDQQTADSAALRIAEYAWNRRRDFAVPAYSAQQAMDIAQQQDHTKGPVVINESSDNTGGGGPGDGTHLLREMLRRDLPGTAMGYIYDPEVAQLAATAGVGAKLSCQLGGKMDNLHGEPVEIRDAYVKSICDGIYVNQSPMGKGRVVDMGLTACLVVGNVSIVVGSKRVQPFDDGALRVAGLRWDLLQYVGIKSSQHFKGWWAERAGGIVPCDSPGIHCADMKTFDFENTNTSYYPLQDAVWE